MESWMIGTIMLMIATLIGLAFYIFYLNVYDDKKYKNPGKLWNFDAAGGYAEGVIREIKWNCRGGRTIVRYFPTDLDNPNKIKTTEEKIVIFGKNKLIVLPRFELSGGKDIFVGLPNKAEDFSPNIKEKDFGKAMMNLTEKISAENAEILALREGRDRADRSLQEQADGQHTKKELKKLLEINNELLMNASRERGFSPSQDKSKTEV